ncbi:hypothetical protein EDB84DRAFT_1440614 [Lactarius hengduanensis]|nr:hypothetical protein EDB84DRAFT_1440614 [Lactarius hengduanensis]
MDKSNTRHGDRHRKISGRAPELERGDSDAVFSPLETCSREAEAREGGEVTVDTTWFSFLLSLTPLPPPPNVPLWPLGPWAPELRVPSRPLKAQGSRSLRRIAPSAYLATRRPRHLIDGQSGGQLETCSREAEAGEGGEITMFLPLPLNVVLDPPLKAKGSRCLRRASPRYWGCLPGYPFLILSRWGTRYDHGNEEVYVVLSQRLALDINTPQYLFDLSSHLDAMQTMHDQIANHMRVCLAVGSGIESLHGIASSEPIFSEAASVIMSSKTSGTSISPPFHSAAYLAFIPQLLHTLTNGGLG